MMVWFYQASGPLPSSLSNQMSVQHLLGLPQVLLPLRSAEITFNVRNLKKWPPSAHSSHSFEAYFSCLDEFRAWLRDWIMVGAVHPELLPQSNILITAEEALIHLLGVLSVSSRSIRFTNETWNGSEAAWLETKLVKLSQMSEGFNPENRLSSSHLFHQH